MTTTTCPICEADAEALPITGDFQGFDCLAHGKFEVSGTAITTHGQKGILEWERALERAQARAESGSRASHYGQRLPLKLAPDHHRKRHDLRRQAIAYEPWLAVGIGLATGAVLFAAGFAFAKLLGL